MTYALMRLLEFQLPHDADDDELADEEDEAPEEQLDRDVEALGTGHGVEGRLLAIAWREADDELVHGLATAMLWHASDTALHLTMSRRPDILDRFDTELHALIGWASKHGERSYADDIVAYRAMLRSGGQVRTPATSVFAARP